MTRWVNLQHVHITSHFQHTRTSWIILAQVFKPWSHRTLKNIVVEVSMVVCRWWWCIEPWLVQKTPDAAWFVSMVHGWWNACITHIYIFYRYMSHTDTHTHIYIHTVNLHCTMWMYIGIRSKALQNMCLPTATMSYDSRDGWPFHDFPGCATLTIGLFWSRWLSIFFTSGACQIRMNHKNIRLVLLQTIRP